MQIFMVKHLILVLFLCAFGFGISTFMYRAKLADVRVELKGANNDVALCKEQRRIERFVDDTGDSDVNGLFFDNGFISD